MKLKTSSINSMKFSNSKKPMSLTIPQTQQLVPNLFLDSFKSQPTEDLDNIDFWFLKYDG